MKDKNSLHTSPQLDNYEQHALALSPKQVHSLYKKSKAFGISLEVLEEVYTRGYNAVDSQKEQSGFNRVDSFLHGGEAAKLDHDLAEGIKRVVKQIGKDLLRTAFPDVARSVDRFKKKSRYRRALVKEAIVVNEPVSTDKDEPASRFVGTDQLVKTFQADTPGQQRAETIKRIVRDKINNDKKDPAQ